MCCGIQKEFVIKDCKVKIYNDGPEEMINIKTDQPCDLLFPKYDKFYR